MPTELPRTQVTHTPAVRQAIEVAARRWPGERPGALLVRLIEEGAKAIDRDQTADREDWRGRVRAVAGKYADVYSPGYLDQLRDGWPR